MKSQKGTFQEGKNERLKDTAKPAILFLIIGVLVLWISYLLYPHPPKDDPFLSNTLSQAAFVVLTITIVNFLWILLGGDPITNTLKLLYETLAHSNDLLRDSRSTGVIAIFAKSDVLSSNDWTKRLSSAKDQVDLMGYTLFACTKGGTFETEVLSLVNRGVDVRILIMDEANPHFGSFLERSDLPWVKSQVLEEQKQARAVFDGINARLSKMNPKPRGSLEIRTVLQGVTASYICRTDDIMTVNTNLYSMAPSLCPLFIIQGHDSPMFQSYEQEFNLLWKLNVPSSPTSSSSP